MRLKKHPARRRRLFFEGLEQRALLATITWTGATNTSWQTASNWSPPQVPGAADDVVIEVPAVAAEITYSAGSTTVQSIRSEENLRITGGTLSVAGAITTDNGTGTVTLAGGTVHGATISQTVIGTNSGGTLNNVTVNGDLDLTRQSNTNVAILGGLVLNNGTMYLGDAAGTTYGRVYFGGNGLSPGSLTGTNATVVFGGHSGFNHIENSSNLTGAAGTLTFGSTVLIRGKTGTIYNVSANGGLVNQGTINVDTAGGTITLGGFGTSSFTNGGTLSASNGGRLLMNGTLTVSSTATISESETSTIQLNTNLVAAIADFSRFTPIGTTVFSGGASNPQLFEAMSKDLGPTEAGFYQNFAMGLLSIGAGSRLTLQDAFDNATGAGAEAVYVDSLCMGAGSRLDLSSLNLKMYARRIACAGEVVNGVIEIVPGTLQVVAVNPLTTGVEFVLSRPVATEVLSIDDMRLTNGAGVVMPGSIILHPGDTRFTFISSYGALPLGTYTLTLVSGANAFRSPLGELLDGNADGVPGDNFVSSFSITTPPNAFSLGLPSFALGPGQVVSLPATAGQGIPLQFENGSLVSTVTFDLQFDSELLNISGVTGVVGGTSNFTLVEPGLVRVTLNFSSPPASGSQVVAFLQAEVPVSAAARYGERGILNFSSIDARDSGSAALLAIDEDALQVNAYFGDVGRNGRYDSFDVQQASRMALRLDTVFQQYPLVDPTILSDFNTNGRIDSFDVQRLSRMALRLPVTEAPPLPNPLPSVTNTGRFSAEEPPTDPKPVPESLTPEAPAPIKPRSDVDGNGTVDAQDVAWAIYYLNLSENGVVPAEAQGKQIDLNGDQSFDAADILLAVTDLNTLKMQSASAVEGENASAAAASEAEEEVDALAFLLAEDLVASRKKN